MAKQSILQLKASKYKTGDKVLYSPILRGVTQPHLAIGIITGVFWNDGKLLYHIDGKEYRELLIKSHFQTTTRRTLKY
jgi:hypothetical protein